MSGIDGSNTRTYKFNTGFSGDPSITKFLCNTNNFSTTSSINISITDNFGANVAAWLNALTLPNASYKAILELTSANGFAMYYVNYVTNNTTYYTLSLTYITSSGVSTFVNNEVVKVSFSLNGSNGNDGSPGADGTPWPDVTYYRLAGSSVISGITEVFHHQGHSEGDLYGQTTIRYSGELVFLPWVVAKDCTINKIAIEIITAGPAKCKTRIGLYDSTNGGYPGGKIADFGELDSDSTGVFYLTDLSFSLTPNLYWLALVNDAGPGVVYSAITNLQMVDVLGYDLSGGFSNPMTFCGTTITYADGLPSDVTGGYTIYGYAEAQPAIFYNLS